MSPKTFFIDKLGVAPEKCLPGRYKDYPRHPCLDVCPKKAITLNPLEIDYGLCDDCGICAGVCPAGALSIKEFFLKELFRQTITEDGLELKIRCSRAGEPCAAVTCLAVLDHAFFVDLCTRGTKNLRLFSGTCESCRLSPGGEIIRSNVNTANNLLLLYERNERVIQAESADRQDLENGSRRAMFRKMGRTITKFLPEFDQVGDAPDPDPVPARRQRSLKIIKGLEEGQRRNAQDILIPFNGKEIDAAKCDGCNGNPRCVSFCPMDALEYSGLAGITFKSARCIGCGLCESACHGDAVKSFTLKSGQLEELWLTKTLMGFEAGECRGCGGISIGLFDGLCQDCQHWERKLGWDIV